MPPIFRKQSAVVCFFCNSTVASVPYQTRQFRCPHCGCWNRFNAAGEIVSDEPAMHDESLNKQSFARRAYQGTDRLPTTFGKGPFCHNCQTNQMLLVNLLSNYLPPTESPEYERRLATMNEYKESLQQRYPPVCDRCQPLVDEELRKKNEMARTKALGGWLQESKGTDKLRRATTASGERFKFETFAWRVRGALWVLSLVSALAGYLAVVLGYHIPQRISHMQPTLLPLVLVSILWTAWDPTYLTHRKAKLQGKGLRIKGKNQYIRLQMLVWSSRLLTSTLVTLFLSRPHLDHLHILNSHSWRRKAYFGASLALELLCLIISFNVLRIQHPAPIRLIDTTTHLQQTRVSPTPPAVQSGRGATPVPSAPDLLSTLTLSAQPVIAPPTSHPVFGLPSLPQQSAPLPTPANDKMDEDEGDAMDVDWSAGSPHKGKKRREKDAGEDDGSWLRPQRFFAPERPTGLEGLFASAKLADEQPGVVRDGGRRRFGWGWVYVGSVVPLLGIAYQAWGWRR